MRVGILGAGAMAEALGGGWVKAGHEVLIGARDAERAAELAAGVGARAGTLREAAGFGDVVLLAVPTSATADVLAAAGAADGVLDGRTVVDCTNAFVPDEAAAEGGPVSFVLSEDAVAERVARLVPGADVVKAFNLCAAEVWAGPRRDFEGRALAVPLCGDAPDAVSRVAGLARDLGLDPLPAGGLARAKYLEATSVFVVGLWFGGHDARAAFPPLEAAFAEVD
ncbi:NADPH-dependent F420 reductase [Yinghuangia seranimata]|uniref:NADPH-dependent F420 reductase n=1 Tax=Yinghuangia seranimata TaxID=408067 RepID=UPI00248BB6F4|nr:NAD(P)-binding domain-containing protein [Yinghuangia seranimata]MDI2131399.1 NAD(P)-binding domain-containing protein [Yinghuangia seranimata]